MSVLLEMKRDNEKFSGFDLAALRSDLLQSGIDFRDAAEMLQAFLWGHGYGVAREAAIAAAYTVEGAGCSIHVIANELERIAQVA